MGQYLTESERWALWDVEDIPAGPAAMAWEPPELKAERYRRALEGILSCSANDRTVWLLQSVAATALGYDALAAELLRQVQAPP